MAKVEMTRYGGWVVDVLVFPECPKAAGQDMVSREVICGGKHPDRIDCCSTLNEHHFCPFDKENEKND
jgi:hypothetical protein